MIFDSTHDACGPLRADERLCGVPWPRLEKVDVPSIQASDLLVLAGGFEDRSIHSLRRICEISASSCLIGLIRYLPEYKENKVQEAKRMAEGAGFSVHEFSYDRQDPANIGQSIREVASSSNRVYVDISGMSRLLIVQIIVELLCSHSGPVSVLYVEADEYYPSQEEFSRDANGLARSNTSQGAMSYLSSGVFEIAATPELGSVAMIGEAIRLIAFPSFDPTQLVNLIQELQPTYTDLVHGSPLHHKDRWRMDAIRKINSQALEGLGGRSDHQSSTLDYRDTLNVLLDIYQRRSIYDRLLISPTGSKMQSVAVGLFRAALNDVQVVYPTPRDFPTPGRYTLGVRQLYRMDLPVEAFGAQIGGFADDEVSV